MSSRDGVSRGRAMELRGVGWTLPVTEKKRGVGGLEEMMGQQTGETRDWRGRCGEAFA
jgi:hypothetical protein